MESSRLQEDEGAQLTARYSAALRSSYPLFCRLTECCIYMLQDFSAKYKSGIGRGHEIKKVLY